MYYYLSFSFSVYWTFITLSTQAEIEGDIINCLAHQKTLVLWFLQPNYYTNSCS